MKSSKILLTSLLAAAAMSATAFAATPTQSTTDASQLSFSGSVNGMDAGDYNDSSYTLTFNTTGGYFGSSASANPVFNQNIVIEKLVSDNGWSTAKTTFAGTVTGSGGFSITSRGLSQDFIFSGDVSGYSGGITSSQSFSDGTKSLGADGEGVIQFGAETAAVATNSTNISGTGRISTTSVLRYNYLAGDSALTVGNSSISARYLEFKGGANYIVSSTVTGNNGTVSNNTLKVSAGTTTFTGAVSKFGTINVASGAKAIFQGAFTNVVGTTKNNLTIAAGSDVSFQSTAAGGVLTANADSTVKFSSTASFTQLSGSGTIDLGSTGTLTLSNPTKFVGWTGTVKLADRGTGNSSNITLANYGTSGASIELAGYIGYFADTTISSNLVLKNSSTEGRNYAVNLMNGSSTGTIKFSGSVSGDGTFQHSYKTGTTNVTQSYMFTGDLSGFSGTFQTGGAASAGDLIFGDGGNGVTGTMDGGAQKSVSGTGTINWKSGKTNALGVVYNYANDVFATNTFAGASTKIVKQGAGSLTLTGTNTYTGGTTVEAGTLVAGSASAFGSGALTVNAGAKVSANGYAVDLGAGNVTINGAYVITAVDSSTTTGTLGTSGTITFGDTGKLDVSGLAAGTYTVFGGTGTVSGLTQDKLYKESGRDTVTFADDTYKTFTLTKGAGVYDLTWTSTAGTWAADTTWQNNTQGGEENPTFADGDTVTFAASETAAKEISVVGAKDAQAVNVTGGDYAFSAGEGGSLSVRGALTVSSGASLTVNEGVLGAVSGGISLAADSTLKLVGTAIHGMTNVVSGEGKVVLNQTSSSTFTISASVFTGGISLEKIGSDTVNLSAAQSHSGGTKITGGALGVNNSSALGSGTLTLNGGTLLANANNLSFSNTVEVTAASGVNTQGNTMTLSGAVSGTGTLTKQGAGTLVLSNAGTSVDVAFAEGNLQVARATVNIVSTTSAGNIEFTGTGGTVVFKGTSEPAGTSYTVGTISTNTTSKNYERNVTIESGATVTATSFTNSWGMGALRVDGELNVTDALSFATGDNNNQTSNIISGDGTVKVGSLNIGNVGTYTISVNRLEIGSGGIETGDAHRTTGKTTYLGNTTIVVSKSWTSAVSSSQKFTLNSSEGTTFELQKADGTATNAAFASIFGGTGKLIKTGAGTLTLSGANTFTGGVEIAKGVVEATNAAALGAAANAVRISGGQLKVSNVTLNQTNISVVLNDGAYLAGAAIFGTGSGALADGTTISVSGDVEALKAVCTSATGRYDFTLYDNNTLTTTGVTDVTVARDFAAALTGAGWTYSLSEDKSILTISVPEPSAFGLLAGAGALALTAARRRRQKKA